MKIYETENYEEMSRKAANILSAQVILKPDCVLGLATGSTPIGTYDKLVEWYEKGDLDFSEVKTVNLDEYRGLTRDNDQSYYYFMLIKLCTKILSKDALFFLVNSYTTGLAPAVLTYMISTELKPWNGHVESQEIGLPVTDSGLVLPCGASGRWESD